jgi:hypothetical protein
MALTAQAAKLFFLFGREALPVSGIDLCLVDPLAKSLDGDVQVAGDLRDGMLLVGGPNQPDGFLLELGRIKSACLAHLRLLSRNLIAQL